MPSSPFVSIETFNGIVRKVEGTVVSGDGIFGESTHNFIGDRINDVLNKCAAAGFEHFDTDILGDAKIYRLKLRVK